MDYKPWMDLIKPEDMPNDDLKFIAESAGIKSALALIFCSPGLTVSIPKNPFREIKEKYIMSQYDGKTYPCPNDIDGYLKNFYSNYMEFPSYIINDSGLRCE